MTVLPYARPLMLPAAGTPARWALLPVQAAPRAANEDHAPPKPGGRRFPLHPDDAIRVDHYMRRHGTDVVTSDGLTALALDGADLVECNASAATPAAQRILVQFCPLAWLGSGTVPAGAPELVDVTDKLLQMTSQEICRARDGSPTANELVEAEDRGHLGPHRVMCEQALCRYFGVEDVADVTEDVIAIRRDGKNRSARRPAHAWRGNVLDAGRRRRNALRLPRRHR